MYTIKSTCLAQAQRTGDGRVGDGLGAASLLQPNNNNDNDNDNNNNDNTNNDNHIDNNDTINYSNRNT